jgi:hypothetical protein
MASDLPYAALWGPDFTPEPYKPNPTTRAAGA